MSYRWLICLPFILALCLANQLVGQINPSEAANKRFAFIDLSKVLRNHEEIRQLQRDFNVLRDRIEAEIDLELKEIENLKEEIMVFAPNSDEFLQKTDEIERKELGINQKKRTIVVKHNNNLIEQLKDSYKAIEKAVKEYAATHGIKSVFTYSYNIDLVDFERAEDVLEWFSTVDVVCHDGDNDITDAVISIVNGS